MSNNTESIQIDLGGGSVSALLQRPANAQAIFTFAHGAGAGMDHSFMAEVADGLADRRIATLRFNFPYREKGNRAPDRPPLLQQTIAAAVRRAAESDLPVVAGGKSMGGRLTAYAASSGQLPSVRALVLIGFPLHPSGKPGVDRWKAMQHLQLPCLFVQGDRDRLAQLDLLRPRIKAATAMTLHVLKGADHGFHVLKRSGKTDQQTLFELCDATSDWIHDLVS